MKTLMKVKHIDIYGGDPFPVIQLDGREIVVLADNGRNYINNDTGEVYEPVFDRSGKLIGFIQ